MDRHRQGVVGGALPWMRPRGEDQGSVAMQEQTHRERRMRTERRRRHKRRGRRERRKAEEKPEGEPNKTAEKVCDGKNV